MIETRRLKNVVIFIQTTLELRNQHLWIRKDGSKIPNPWEIIDKHKRHNCAKCRK